MEKEKELKGAFVERDLSWMYFNHRILQEAEKKDVPILERMSFLGIYSNNLDEFFRVRMASLNRIAQSKDKNIKQDREKAKKTIKDINHLNACYNKEFEKAVDNITEELEKQGIRLLHENELNEEQLKNLLQIHDEMKPLSVKERIDKYGLKPDRADVIIPAAEIFLNVAQALGCTEIHVPNISLADGIIDGMYKEEIRS